MGILRPKVRVRAEVFVWTSGWSQTWLLRYRQFSNLIVMNSISISSDSPTLKHSLSGKSGEGDFETLNIFAWVQVTPGVTPDRNPGNFHSDFSTSYRFALTTKCIKQRIEITHKEHSKVFDVSYNNFGEKTLQTNR